MVVGFINSISVNLTIEVTDQLFLLRGLFGSTVLAKKACVLGPRQLEGVPACRQAGKQEV
jgi:hypothetical protein